MSSTLFEKEEEEEEGKDVGGDTNTTAGTTNGPSGFDFLSSVSARKNDGPKASVEESATAPTLTADESNPVSSGFSFLSSTITNEADVPPPVAEPQSFEAKAPESLPKSKTATAATTNESIFSMLSSNLGPSDNASSSQPQQQAPPSLLPEAQSSSTWGIHTKPPLPTATATTSKTPASDFLMQVNPSQPAGSGIVFGGAAKPRAVKKRARGKKIGVGSSSSSTGALPAPSLPEPSSFTPEPSVVTLTQEGEKQDVMTGEDEGQQQQQPQHRSQKSLSDEASDAASRAEEFMSSKKSTPSSYTGRYSGDKTLEEDSGHVSSSSSVAGNGTEDQSEEYKKAKAAAEEAKNLNRKVGGFMGGGMSGGFSGLFKRNFIGGPPSARSSPITNGDVDGQDSNVPGGVTTGKSQAVEQKPKQEWKVPIYGEPDEPAQDEAEEVMTDDEDLELRERREEEIRRELEEENMRKEQQRILMEEELREKEMIQRKEAERIQREEEEARQRQLEEQERQRKIQEEEEAKRMAPGVQLAKIIDEFSVRSQNATCAMGELRQERASLFERRLLAEKQQRLAIQQISQAEAQQMEAAEQEDFDLADRLAAVIEQHEKEKAEYSKILDHIKNLISTLEQKRVNTGKSLVSCFEGVQGRLKEFLEEQENSDIKDSSEVMKKFEADTKRLAAENERLVADLKNIERDETFVAEEKEELEASITEQTGGIEVLRDAASAKLKGVNDEIEELRRQLEEKEMQAAEMKMELHRHEESIENIRGTFSRQLTRLVKKEAAIKESRKEWAAEESSYKLSRLEHEQEVTAHSEALVAHDKLVSQIKDETIIAEKLSKVIGEEIIISAVESNDASEDEVTLAQAEVLRCEAAVDEANQLLMTAKASIDNLRDEIGTIEVRVPILEAEKKQAASKRDFKAAGKASKTIKELLARKERCNEELADQAIERQAAAQMEVDMCLETLKEKKALSHEKEKEGGRKRMIQLVKKMVKLEKLRDDICGTGEEECTSQSITVVGGFVLDSEIAALVAEGEELDSKFGGWTDIMMEFAEASEDTSSEEIVDEELDAQLIADNEVGDSSEVITDEEVAEAQLAEEENNSDGNINDDVDEAGEADEVDKSEAMKRCKVILSEIDGIESEIEAAIEVEEYDLAAELDEKILNLKDELKSLGLSDSEIEVAKTADVEESADDSKGSSQCTEKSYDMVSSKSGGNDEEEVKDSEGI
mmetsp:Transcript_13150/g.19916  ORF Transcript_13150/g.19916 Transcript_13150/m.19916 type:complete len:1217 (-) Transcript_13150:1275-4925(-)